MAETEKKPEIKTFDSFSEFVEGLKTFTEKELSYAQYNLQKGWFQPDKEKDSSSLDIAKIPNKFERDDLQDAYNSYMAERKPPAEALSIKFQNGFIAANEQAYRIRHVSLPRALAQGYSDGIRWEAIPFLLISRITVLSDLVEKDYNNRH